MKKKCTCNKMKMMKKDRKKMEKKNDKMPKGADLKDKVKK